MSRKAFTTFIKSIFAPGEVAATAALVVLVIGFGVVYFNARPRPMAPAPSPLSQVKPFLAPTLTRSASPTSARSRRLPSFRARGDPLA